MARRVLVLMLPAVLMTAAPPTPSLAQLRQVALWLLRQRQQAFLSMQVAWRSLTLAFVTLRIMLRRALNSRLVQSYPTLAWTRATTSFLR